MGLDITAYSRLKHVGKHTEDDWCDQDEHINVFAYSEFPQSFRGLPVLGSTAVPSGTEFISAGCYVETDETECHSFRAGSYGGYNQWRADLAGQFNPAPVFYDNGPGMKQPDPDKPFYELIWFADNEGSIGPDAAKDLLADFREHAAEYAAAHPDDDERGWYRRKYEDWTRAFELAADGGLVRFH